MYPEHLRKDIDALNDWIYPWYLNLNPRYCDRIMNLAKETMNYSRVLAVKKYFHSGMSCAGIRVRILYMR